MVKWFYFDDGKESSLIPIHVARKGNRALMISRACVCARMYVIFDFILMTLIVFQWHSQCPFHTSKIGSRGSHKN